MLSSVCINVESEELDGIDREHSLLVITSEIWDGFSLVGYTRIETYQCYLTITTTKNAGWLNKSS